LCFVYFYFYFFFLPFLPTAHAVLSYCCACMVILYRIFCNCIVLPMSRICSPVLRSTALTRF
jgi:hypothetical protein